MKQQFFEEKSRLNFCVTDCSLLGAMGAIEEQYENGPRQVMFS